MLPSAWFGNFSTLSWQRLQIFAHRINRTSVRSVDDLLSVADPSPLQSDPQI